MVAGTLGYRAKLWKTPNTKTCTLEGVIITYFCVGKTLLMSAISLFVPEQISLFLIVPHTNHNQAFEVYSCEENNASLMADRRTRLQSRQPANCEQGCVCWCVCVQTEASSKSLIITYHFLRLAEIYVFLVLAA